MCSSEDAPRVATKSAPKGPRKSRFEVIYSKGRRTRGDLLTLIQIEGTGFVGIAVGRKIGCHARRNRLRRQIRELLSALPLPNDRDLIVVVGVRSANQTFATLRDELTALYREASKDWANASECS